MWTYTARTLDAQSGLALATDLTDAQWAIFEPRQPRQADHRSGKCAGLSRPSSICSEASCRSECYPPRFAPVSTVRRWFYLWRDTGLRHAVNHGLLMLVCEAQGHEASHSAGVINSQNVKTRGSGGS